MKQIDRIRLTQIIFWFAKLIFFVCSEDSAGFRLRGSQDSSSSRLKVGIVMMVHDEEDLLPYWLRYHSAIVGVENIVILDQKSKSEKTKMILRTWSQERQLKVLWDQGPYSAKGDLTYHAFQQYLGDIDIALPLDSDEFLVAFNGSQPVFSRNAIVDKLRYFWESKAACWGFQQYYATLQLSLNDSLKSIHYFHPATYTLHHAKKMIRWENLKALDHGSHQPTVSNGSCVTALNHLGLLHYHFRNPLTTVERALNDVLGFGYLPSNVTVATLKDYQSQLEVLSKKRIAGTHKMNQLLKYLEKGFSGLLHKNSVANLLDLGTIDDIVRRVETDPSKVAGKR
mmetsp:Transcript_27289/g.29788  ORF Transcript_27289/g.29788 Transcript_27289/m.29788 type:complete len:340 (+) Transcript_27289:82-1101(+)